MPKVDPAPGASRWLALPLLAVSVGVGWYVSDVLPLALAASLPASGALLVLRLVWLAVEPRLGTGAAAGFVALNLALTLVGTWFNPFLSIYGFIGYTDVTRHLSGRAEVAGVVATALVVGTSQAGGIPGSARLPILAVGLVAVNMGVALAMVRLHRDRERQLAEREEAAQALVRASAENAALHRRLAHEQGVAQERARLSRELHDTVAQGLVGVICQLEAIDSTSVPQDVAARVGAATASARDCLVDARRAVRALAPKELAEHSLADAVHDLARTWARAHRIVVEVDTDEAPEATPHDETVVRVVQEALSNVARHSGATSARIVITGGPGVEVLVEDDGSGFDPAAPSVGLGLAGMTARVEQAGGTLGVESSLGTGCRVLARLP